MMYLVKSVREGCSLTENMTGHASSADPGALAAADGDIIRGGEDDDVLSQSLGPRPFCGKAKMQPVTGVVGDEEDGTLVRGGESHGGHDLLGARRGEDVTARDGGEQAVADEPAPRRLVSGATAADDAHCRRVIVPVGDDALRLVEDEVRVGCHESAEGSGDQRVCRGRGEVVLGRHFGGKGFTAIRESGRRDVTGKSTDRQLLWLAVNSY